MPIKDMLKKDSDPLKSVALHGPEDIHSCGFSPFSCVVRNCSRSEWKRIPGLFRKWEFAQLINDNDAISFQKQGKTEDGTQLWALYRHCPEDTL